MTPSEASMDEILKCAICVNEFVEPRQLKCGHVFCFKCIDTDYKFRDRNNGKCPECRADYWLSPKRVTESLPECSIPLRHILSLRKSTERCCEYNTCDRKSAMFICIRCRQWLCDTCKSTNCTATQNPLRMHDAFQEHELDSFLFDIVSRSRHNMCRRHSRHDTDWYCRQCRTLACNVCKFNLHAGHGEMMTMEDKGSECRADLEKAITSLKEKQSSHRTNKATLTMLLNPGCNEFVNVQHCNTALDHCNIGLEECEKLIRLISLLLENGSTKVIIETALNLEERIGTELEKCLLLEKVREVFLASATEKKPEATVVKSGDDNQMTRNGDACEHDDSEPSAVLCVEACESTVCTGVESATWICLLCKKWICGSCKTASCPMGHLPDKSHSVLNPSIDSTLYDIVVKSRCSSCTAHPENDVESYCSNCHVITCGLCRHRHEHHGLVTITTRSKACRDTIKVKRTELSKKVEEYEITKSRVSKIKSICNVNVLNHRYFESVTNECILRKHKCDHLNKILHFLHQYASEKVIVEMFDAIESEIREEIQKDPSDILSELRRVIKSIGDTLSQPVGDEEAVLSKTTTLHST